MIPLVELFGFLVGSILNSLKMAIRSLSKPLSLG
jgi:hypothetical protein